MNRLYRLLLLASVVFLFACASTADTSKVERYHSGDWEHDAGYTQAIRHGRQLYVSGVISRGETMQDQVTNVYREIKKILAHFDADMDNIVKEVLYTTDMEAMKNAIPARKAYFKNGIYPSATWVQIDRLFEADAMLEVEVEVMLDH